MPILTAEEKMAILSYEERDRRWKKVREQMKKQGLDCLIIFGSYGRFRHLKARL
jgi:hypothetical protein